MHLEIYQWLVPLIAVAFIYRTIRQYKARHRSIRGATIWVCFWVVLIVLSVMPDAFSNRMAEALGFKSNINAVIFVGLGLLFLITFYLSDALHDMERKVTELVRELAIERANADKDKDAAASHEQEKDA